VGALNDAWNQSCTIIIKQNVKYPIACLSTNIDLETNYKSIPQNVPTFHGHVS
jgi:hypothetical protein